MDSSYVIRWAYSTYAEGNCDSDAPFYDRCNTQLRVGLSFFLLLLVPFAYILLAEYTLHGAWLRGSSLHFLLHVLSFVLLTYPWHLGQLAFVWVSILVVKKWLYRRDVPSTVLSYGCNLVDG